MPISYMIGTIFFFILFVVGMINASQSTWMLVLGIVGLIGTAYFIIRIVSDVLREMHRRNTEKD
ncbi:MAG: hypothetical protein ACI33P_05425 [Lysinibacillus sp.]